MKRKDFERAIHDIYIPHSTFLRLAASDTKARNRKIKRLESELKKLKAEAAHRINLMEKKRPIVARLIRRNIF